MTGQTLIRAAELRSVTTDFEQWQTAVNTYKGKYFSLPGDTPNATAFWGSANGASCNAPSTGTGTGTQTCNGDGNGIITYTPGAGDRYVEMFMFWQHLANSGLINGTFSGKAEASNADHAIINSNVPSAKLSGAGWSLIDNLFVNHPAGSGDNTDVYGAQNSGWPMIFGQQFSNWELYPPALRTDEAWNIDTKIDDGIGSSGIIVIDMNTESANCRNSETPMSYALSQTNITCTLLFRH